jgi:hypothetical protein
MNPVILPAWVRMAVLVPVVLLALAGSATDVGAQRASTSHRVQTSAPKPRPSGSALAPWPDTLGRLVIKRLGIDAVARPVGLDDSGTIGVTSNVWDVGVFEGTVIPGQPGNSLVEGHLDWSTGRAVFWDLHLLQKGDEIDFIENSGATDRFAVTGSRTVPYNSPIAPELLVRTGTPTVTLITCAGGWVGAARTYSTRLLVTAAKTG